MPLVRGKVQISPFLRAPLGTLSAKGAEGVYTRGVVGRKNACPATAEQGEIQ